MAIVSPIPWDAPVVAIDGETQLAARFDAANIDLKSFRAEYYRQTLRGELDEVKRFLRQVAGSVSLEVTTLVIPGDNDAPEEIDGIARSMTPMEVKARADRGEDFIWLDVRSPEEFKRKRIDDPRVRLLPPRRLIPAKRPTI